MKRWSAVAAALAAGALLIGTGGAASAQFPGRNGAIAYVFEDSIFDGTDCLVDLSGTDLPYESAGGIAWAKGGARAAIVSTPPGDYDGTPGVYVLQVSPCSTPRFVSSADRDSTPSFSPDGKQLAVQRGNRIVVLDVATGRTVRDLAAGKDPSWSPDGKRIAYVDGTTIKTRPATGGSSTTFKTNASAPDYSPDGTKLAYLTGGKIAYATASNGASTKTTPISAREFTWSPDGTSFAFISPTEYIVVARTTGYITARPTEGEPPNGRTHISWQPLP